MLTKMSWCMFDLIYYYFLLGFQMQQGLLLDIYSFNQHYAERLFVVFVPIYNSRNVSGQHWHKTCTTPIKWCSLSVTIERSKEME